MSLKSLKIGDLVAPIPVIQGGMGVGISLSKLAGTVASEGGVGIISTAQIGFSYPAFDLDPIATNLQAIKDEIVKARKIAMGGIVGVNIMVATRKYEEYVKSAVAAGADLIISGAGLPMTLPDIVKGTKTMIAPIVSSLKSAKVILKYWIKKYNKIPDLVVIEGPEAGGHLGFRYEQLANIEDMDFKTETRNIIEFVKEWGNSQNKDIPVVTAGGIYDRKNAEEAEALGADGVQMGTRFVTTYECDAPDTYKQTYLNAQKEDVVLIKSPVGMPGRAIRNSFYEKTLKGIIPHGKCRLCLSTCKPTETPYCITSALVNAAEGKVEDALLFCGTNAYRADKIEHVRDIMQEFVPD